MLYAHFQRSASRALALVLLALPAWSLAEAPVVEAQEEGLLPLEDLRIFTRVYDHIRSGYVEELSDAELLEYAIRGMIAELDPHSAYLDESSFEDLQVHTTGEFGGIGIEVGMEDGFVKVISPIDDTPAHKAGIQAGDLIIRLDDQPVKGMSLSEAVEKMRGPKGSTLEISIVRQGIEQPMEITLIRDVIRVRSVRTQVLDDAYAYVRIAQFQVGTGPDVVQAIDRLQQEHPDLKGIILDLRNNPGGVLQASVDVADAFLDGGLVVYTEGRLENSDIRYYANPGDVVEDLPIVALINEGSASAAEIVAGALQDHGRAIVLGTRSFGKGSVQTVVPISETRAIKLTTALYYTPKGRSIQAQGIAPDIAIDRAKVTLLPSVRRPTEADLSRHLGNTNGGPEHNSRTRSSERAPRSELLTDDNQLSEALNLLKGLSIYQNRLTLELEQMDAEHSEHEARDGAPEARTEQ